MKYVELRKKLKGTYFTLEDLMECSELNERTVRVLATRYAKKGLFLRLKRNLYVIEERWENFSEEDFFKVANVLQVPSYISLMTALSFYEITTQVQRRCFESISLRRSAKMEIKGVRFNFYRVNSRYYFDFYRKDDFFIATREKAFVDSIYLYSFGKYSLDIDSLDIEKLDRKKLREIVKKYPQRTKKIVNELCGI